MGFALATWLQTASGRALDLLFPPICVSCDSDMADDEQKLNLCQACESRMPFTDWPTCRRCASRVPEFSDAVEGCGHCCGDKLRFDSALSLGSYEGLLRELVLRMKSDRSERLAGMFSSLLFAKMEAAIRDWKPSVIVPIPVARWRRMTRGTSPADAMAEGLGRKLGLPVLPRVLRCRRNSFPQKGLSRQGRFRNMHGQIWARAGYPLLSSHVLLIDDVLTTGATCSEAARVLKQNGAAKVSVLVVGRTPSA